MKQIANLFVTLIIVFSVIVGSSYAGSGVNSRVETDGEYGSIPINSQIAQQAMSKTQNGKNITIDSLRIENLSTVVTGTIVGWPESGFVFQFDDYVSVVSDIQAWWSINTINPDRGWFYGYNSSTEVAHVTGITDICEITDASIYTYDSWSVGPVDEGDFVLFHNINTDYYAAFRVDDIYGTGVWDSYLDATWYFQEDGSPNFGPCLWETAYSTLFDSLSELELLRQYRDEILSKTTKGEMYKTLLYMNSEEALEVLLDNPELMLEAKYLIEANKDAVSEVLNGNEGVIYNTDEIVSFLDTYAKNSPPALKTLAYMVKMNMSKKQKEGKLFLGFRLE